MGKFSTETDWTTLDRVSCYTGNKGHLLSSPFKLVSANSKHDGLSLQPAPQEYQRLHTLIYIPQAGTREVSKFIFPLPAVSKLPAKVRASLWDYDRKEGMTSSPQLQMDYLRISKNSNPYSVSASLALQIISIQYSHSRNRSLVPQVP